MATNMKVALDDMVLPSLYVCHSFSNPCFPLIHIPRNGCTKFGRGSSFLIRLKRALWQCSDI